MTNAVTRAILWLLGIRVPKQADSLHWQLEGIWPWVPGAIVLAVIGGVLCAAYIGWLYAYERSPAGRAMRMLLGTLRFLALALVLLVMLYGLRIDYNRTSQPSLALLIDESGSMAEVDDYEDAALKKQLVDRQARAKVPSLSRLDAAKAVLLADNAAVLNELHQRYKLHLYSVGGSVRRLPDDLAGQVEELRKLRAADSSSRLGTDLQAVLDDLRGTQPAGLIYLGDGITTAGPGVAEIAPTARRRGTPLYLIATGSEKPARTIQLDDLLVDDVISVNDPVTFDLKLTATGLKDRMIELVLKDAKTGQVLDRQQIVGGTSGQSQRARLSHRPTVVGRAEYIIDVESPKADLKNKVTPLAKAIDVRKTRIKVLLAQGYPNYEYRYLKNMLSRDETVELKTFLQEADVEHAEQDRTALKVFPVGWDELKAYDVLILGDIDPGQLGPSVLTNVANFVKVKGGGVLFISGPRFNPSAFRDTPLAGLMPIDLKSAVTPPEDQVLTDPVNVRLTPLGLSSPHLQLGNTPAESEQIFNDLPDVYFFVEAPEIKAGARVLAEHPARTGRDGRKLPLILVEQIPPGKVIWHATDETYRWRFRVGDALFARYWIQTIRYLARSNAASENGPVQLTSDRREYDQTMPVQLRVRFFDERLAPRADDGVSLVVEAEGQTRRNLTLARDASSREIFTGTLANLPDGSYHAWVKTPTTGDKPPSVNFRVVAPSGEFARVDADYPQLQAAAVVSSGKIFTLATAEQLLADLPVGRSVRVDSLPPEPLWNNWRILLLLVGLLATEWLLRKRKGML